MILLLWLVTAWAEPDTAQITRILDASATVFDPQEVPQLVLMGLSQTLSETREPRTVLLPDACAQAISAGVGSLGPARRGTAWGAALDEACPTECGGALPPTAPIGEVLAACDAAGPDTLFAEDMAVRGAADPRAYRVVRLVWDALVAATAGTADAPKVQALRRGFAGEVVMSNHGAAADDWLASANVPTDARAALALITDTCETAGAERLAWRALVGPDGALIRLLANTDSPTTTWGDCRHAPLRARLPPTTDGALGVVDFAVTRAGSP